MAETNTIEKPAQQPAEAPAAAAPVLHVAPGPHFGTSGRSTRWMMYDVLIALAPAVAAAHLVFGLHATQTILLSVVSCMLTELVFQLLRGRRPTLTDGSAGVTGLILALSLPWTVPWYVPVVGGVVAVGIGKMIFGGLGQNLFNPAMVGRAFLMFCFVTQMTTWVLPGGQGPLSVVDAFTGATPMGAAKLEGVRTAWQWMFVGNVNGSLGETSALALLLGGLYLCVRRSAAWQIPAGVFVAVLAIAGLRYAFDAGAALTPVHHLFGGALMFGAFFIATDPVSSPVSVSGRWVFGLLVGALTMVIRLWAGYPEGVMFAVLLANSVTPLINRWTIPRPVGGPGPRPAKA